MFLVDTSVWIEVFAKPSRVRLTAEIPLDQIVTCLPIVQEVLQGFREEAAFRIARESLTALPIVESPLTWEVFEMAAQLYRTARRAGLTVRSGVDCLIAACALRNDLTVLHSDRDFSLLAKISPLQERRVTRLS
jgi:predicted nucleic acid-binding protein